MDSDDFNEQQVLGRYLEKKYGLLPASVGLKPSGWASCSKKLLAIWLRLWPKVIRILLDKSIDALLPIAGRLLSSLVLLLRQV